MRAGWIVSAIGHVGAVMMTLLAWEARSTIAPSIGAVVPVEIVEIGPESNVRALAEDVPENEVVEQLDETVEAEPDPAPAPEAPPPRQRPPRPADDFDINAAARLVDRSSDTGRRRNEGETADRNQRGAGRGTAEVAALEDRVRALMRQRLMRCWRMPIDLPDPERLVVTVEFELDRNGNLRGQPRVTSPRNYTFDRPMAVAAEAALRAVRSCDFTFFPQDPVVGQHYDAWDDLEFTFRPPT